METRSPSRRPPSNLTQIRKHKPEWESVTRKDPRGEVTLFWGEMNLLNHSWMLGSSDPQGRRRKG